MFTHKLLLAGALCLLCSPLFACHDVSVTEVNAVDNGDGTYTHTFQICVGDLELTYGFYLSFSGSANILSYTNSVTSSNTGNTIFASSPPVSGNGDLEYGDWDNTSSTLFSDGTGNVCVVVSVTFDGPIFGVDIDGAQPVYVNGPCASTGSVTCLAPAYRLRLTTDNYGGETSWSLTNQVGGATVVSGSGYASNATYNIDLCVPNLCYNFNIFDSYGDGICCVYGLGSYSVTDFNGTVVAAGGVFGNSQTTNIGCNTLPVDFLDWQVEVAGEQVDVNWTTANETNNCCFLINRTTDFQSFETLSEVPGAASPSDVNRYSYTDHHPVSGTSYYQLVQVDNDGSRKVIGMKAVEWKAREIFQIYPNPVKDVLQITQLPEGYTVLDFEVTDMNGKRILKKQVSDAQAPTVSLDVYNLRKGVYGLRLIADGRLLHQERFVKVD